MEQILADCQAEIINTNSRLIMTEDTKIEWNDRVAARRISSCSSTRTPSTKSSTYSWTVFEAKLGFTWSSWEKPQWNGRIEAISRLNIRHNCEGKIDRMLFWNLLARYRNCKNEIHCMNHSKDFQDAESLRSGHSHVTSQPVSSPPHPVAGGMLSRSIGMPSRREGPPRKCFCKSMCVLFSTLPAGIESMEFGNIRAALLINGGEVWETNTSSRSEMPIWTVSQKFSHP